MTTTNFEVLKSTVKLNFIGRLWLTSDVFILLLLLPL